MNKTLTINLSGIVFHIDENAYDVFNAYVDSIRRHFASSEGKDEIMQDIEARIAEMFQLRVGESKQVITLRDVEEVTSAMGRPEQFGDEEATVAADKETPLSGVKRRLFRSSDDEIIGGVCSGIAAYFGIDPVWLRLAFVLSVIFFGTGIFLYIILWIVIPEAKTTADKLMMRGEQVTISNIEKNVREEVEGLKKRAGEFGKQVNQKFSDYSGFRGFLRRLFDAFGELLGFVFKIFVKLFAVLFIIIGLLIFGGLLFALIMVPGFWVIKLPPLAFPALLAALFLVGIPALLLFYHGFKILFNIKSKSKVMNMVAGGIWLVGLVIGIITTVLGVKNYSEEESTRQELGLIQPANDTLMVSIKNNISDIDSNEDMDIFNGWSFDSHDTAVTITGPVKVDVRKSSSDKFELIKIVESRGSSRRDAAENAKGVKLTFGQTDNRLTLENNFQLTKNTMFAFQNIKFVIGVPEGKTVYLGRSLRYFLFDVKNTGGIYDDDMAPHYWKMTEKGLACTDCTGDERSIKDFDATNEGVHIGNGMDSVVVDKHGIVIKKDGEDVLRIDDKGMVIKKPDDKK
jgi:phage shock protein PspC (stress-responsive transcriptional regulator)